jgi:hypothetical protein
MRQTLQAIYSPLNHAALAVQRQYLLCTAPAAARPESRSAAAGENNRAEI